MDIHQLTAYEVIEERRIADVDSMSYLLRHKKSGARVAILSNSDSNKVFYIGFKTPPKDGCGVPHIIEHTVLCGSEKYPAKDPFVELVKGSLNTFLNAMTYPDKTVYPIASYNDQDFKNLMDVYMDAVLHPNITKRREIFMQEGWHYELENADAPLMINGVVYNEMKGAYSAPEELLQTEIDMALFPNNTYSCNSGGDPKQIPQLTYEAYLDFYREHYHPSNSYIYLYGDMDVVERLEWMDREYLSHYERANVDSDFAPQEAFAQMADVTAEYPIASGEPEENQTYLAYSKVIGSTLDERLNQAMDVLEYALVSAPGAPIKQALVDAGIGQDVYSVYDVSRQQPTFTIIAKNANTSDKERFVQIIEEQLRRLAEEGINRESLLAGINSDEFRFREADFGTFPKGLLYGLQCLDGWIFDEEQPFLKIECLENYAALRKEIDSGYFEQLIRDCFLENTHGAVVRVVPKRGAAQEDEERLSAQLAEYKASLSEAEIEALVRQTAELKAYQEEPDSPEDLRRIPLLERSDLRREATPFSNIEETLAGVPVVRHDEAANGIDYLTFYFEMKDLPVEDLAVVGVLRAILSFVDTTHYSYLGLSNAINIYTGGISAGNGLYPDVQGSGNMDVKFEIAVKTLEENLPKAMDLVREILLDSKLDDVKRLQEIFAQVKSRLQSSLSSSGHNVAANRSLSRISRYAYYQDALYGIDYYQHIAALEEQLGKDSEAVIGRLSAMVKKIFVKERLLVSFTADTEAYHRASAAVEALIAALPDGEQAGKAAQTPVDACADAKPAQKTQNTGSGCPAVAQAADGDGDLAEVWMAADDGGSVVAQAAACTPYGEGFCDASQIQYVARGGNFVQHGYSYSGHLNVLKMILGYDYLWMNIRVLGGAYGCMNRFMRCGECTFVSYRDPNLKRTIDIYEGIPEYLRNFEADERDMTKYIIGTFGSMDTPLYPEGRGTRSMNAYLQRLTIEQVQQERDEVLATTQEDIRALADLVEAALSDQQLCVIGNENAIQKEEALFDKVQGLYEV